MKFIEITDLEKYENFVANNKYKSHFMQSTLWGTFCKEKRNNIPYYLGIVDENENLLCATLLLKRNLGMGFCYFYAPRGFVIDFSNIELLEKFTIELKKFIKKHHGIYLKIDPDYAIKSFNYLNEEDKSIPDYKEVFDNLISLGYKHKGFTQRFELNQPRFTFRINFKTTFEEIYDHFSKTTKQRIKKAEELGAYVELATNTDEFYNLMQITENRKNFSTYDKSYYETLYKIFEKNCKIFLGKINIKNIIEKIDKNLKTLSVELKKLDNIEQKSKSVNNKIKELTKQIDKLEKDKKIYDDALKQFGEIVTLSAHFIVNYGNKAWVLYAGNHDILSFTYVNYKTYLEHIRYYYNEGIEIYDQFGTVGKIEENDHLMGLHEFKKKFGGDYVEFIGEFDLVNNKILYTILPHMLKFYRKLKK